MHKGNSSTQTQDVVITDTTAPVADHATLADVTAECEVTALTDQQLQIIVVDW